MAETKSFKENVLDAICLGAKVYKSVLLDYEYKIISKAFKKQKSYLISATKENFLHLTGVHTELSAREFYNKALSNSLQLEDFDFKKKGQDEKSVKGSVRRKVKFLSQLDKIFQKSSLVEEQFIKNKIFCTFAMSDNSFTLGFISTPKCRPKTLLKGNELKSPCKIGSIQRRKHGETEFTEI